jgi:hypothetical protein
MVSANELAKRGVVEPETGAEQAETVVVVV